MGPIVRRIPAQRSRIRLGRRNPNDRGTWVGSHGRYEGLLAGLRLGQGGRAIPRCRALPTLPFADAAFEMALCSHLLFLYSSQLGEAFDRAAVREMCRVAAEVRIFPLLALLAVRELCRVSREVRVFPLLALGGARSPYVERIAEDVGNAGHEVCDADPSSILCADPARSSDHLMGASTGRRRVTSRWAWPSSSARGEGHRGTSSRVAP